MSTEVEFNRGEGGGPAKDRYAMLADQLDKAQDQLELGAPGVGAQTFWDVWAVGPYQGAGLAPGRIIQVGQQATVDIVVWLNPFFPAPVSACGLITGFGADIELNIFTSNMQTMQPVPALSTKICVQTVLNQCRYVVPWTFTPTTTACLYETNICARVCNCNHIGVPEFYAFARWVRNLDYELMFPPVSLTFDHPIRYAVFDFNQPNCCP